ncbi:cob(I)alamin adenosyltransferase [Salsuginibacillus halophilus]|uniref:Corrinoid adenosyltransferase n=1 Tax=Salsuginibacillus halophilus TaxID=517424 RepID=A0A2P8HW97_9BACI|nr:cob(I)yrinic acid a,c-diamide adenosyltransferase [Salsuginibacillus halophilus]PSL50448.1 cob(I)alamin adenosyltransferase [Salsuginibacillus halophilus]
MKLYTKGGDHGQTSIIGGRRDKDDIRIEAYGTVDELNSFVGLAAAELDVELTPDVAQELINIQHELFDCGSDLATIKDGVPEKVTPEMIEALEKRIDAYTEEAPALERFILPGGSKASAHLHASRTIARRAERIVTALLKEEETNLEVMKYLNRLSDYFFAAARIVNARQNVKDVEYERSAVVFHTSKKSSTDNEK